ncbi:hypothetical protein GCM10027022_18840 [Alpinimonas psychrophila]
MGEFVDQSHCGISRQHSGKIHFGKFDAAMGNGDSRDYFEALSHRRRGGATVSFYNRDDDIFTLTQEAFAFLKHGVGFPDAGSGTEQHSKAPSFHG